jgi:hypothetical protein
MKNPSLAKLLPIIFLIFKNKNTIFNIKIKNKNYFLK